MNSKPNVLLLEDDEDIRDFLSGLLISYGCNAFMAESFTDVADTLSQNSINMVLLDIMLPGTDGREVAEFIHKNYPDISIYYMTGAEHCLESSHLEICDGVLSKPFTIEELKNVIYSKLLMPAEETVKNEKQESLELLTSFATEYEALRRQNEKFQQALSNIPDLDKNSIKEKIDDLTLEHKTSLEHLKKILEKARKSLKS
ncbi:MAG: response regulator [Planctomycetota bacterium]|jgi:DNA-binding NtrC family response regulator